jgi:hypothetical protein
VIKVLSKKRKFISVCNIARESLVPTSIVDHQALEDLRRAKNEELNAVVDAQVKKLKLQKQLDKQSLNKAG